MVFLNTKINSVACVLSVRNKFLRTGKLGCPPVRKPRVNMNILKIFIVHGKQQRRKHWVPYESIRRTA